MTRGPTSPATTPTASTGATPPAAMVTVGGTAGGTVGAASPVTVTSLSREDGRRFIDLDQWAFAYDLDEVDSLEELVDEHEWDRTFGALRDGRLAGIYGTFSLNCPLPGGTSAAAGGLTWVAVHPRDRRRGVLTAMINHHLSEVRRRGEPASLLFAAEPPIYGRFGYGMATRAALLRIGRGAALRDVPGSDDLTVDFELADPDRHGGMLAACLAAVASGRPGCVVRTATDDVAPGVHRGVLLDPPRGRRGAESLRVALVHDRDGELRAYALFQRRSKWDDGTPNGTVEIREAVARDAVAARALWQRLVDLDLTATTETPQLAIDDPLLHLLVDVRAVRPRLTDGLWARLVDVPAALAARRYATEVDVVIEVVDRRMPDNAGRWRVTGDASSATCTATQEAPAVTLDVRELGSAWLGGITLAELATAGLVTVHDAEALTAASVAFASPISPWCARPF